jgi:endonuclease/exonuclease/phosphatase family metal-dependent hydrolase
MKVISLNVECDKHYERIFSFLEQQSPDVICLQEVLEDDFPLIQKTLAMDGVFKSQGYFDSKHDSYKDSIGRSFGIAIFSKKIIHSGYFYYWGKEENTTLPFESVRHDDLLSKNYVLVWVDAYDENGNILRCITTHLPVTKEGESSPFQLAVLEPFLQKLETFGDFFVCGDFNAPRGNETFRRVAEKYKDCIPEKYTTSLDQNLHRIPNLQFMVDCFFTTKECLAEDISFHDGVSDHMAIVANVKRI